jgi:long-chain acyl-CoA synthetase
MELLTRYLEGSERPVYALVRADDEAVARERVRDIASQLYWREDAYEDRLVPVLGDVEEPGLGLAASERESLAERVGEIVHSAASVSFELPLEDSRRINVDGTRHLLDFGELCRERGGLRRFSYISTAYVAGTHSGEFGEEQLDVGQGFRNAYEQSKFEAERLVRSHGDRFPIQVFRPSIIVGERGSGWTASFNVLYAPLKAFARGLLPILPARRRAPVDVVPVDYVADAVFELSRQPADGTETYHLVAGPRATTVGDLVDLSASRLGRRKPLMVPPALYRRLLHPLLLRRSDSRRRRALERMETFFPYFSMRVRYRDSRARRRLEPKEVRVTPIEGYFGRLLDFAQRTRWGQLGVGRAEARARTAAGDVGG